jgi:hypothetical protein
MWGYGHSPYPHIYTSILLKGRFSVDSLLQTGSILNLLYGDVEVVKITTGRDKVDYLKNSELTLPQHYMISHQRSLISVDDGSRVLLSSYDVTDFVICRHKKTLTGWSGADAAT